MASIADVLTTRRPIGSPTGPSMPDRTPSRGRGTRELYDAKRGPDGQGPSAPSGGWWDGEGRIPIGVKAPPDDPRVSHPNVPPGDSGSGATPPGSGGGPAPNPDDGTGKPGPTPGTPGESEFPFDFGKGYEVSDATPGGTQYAPGFEPIPTFDDGGAKLGPDQGANVIDWMSATGLLPEGVSLSGDGYPMTGGGSSGPWGQAGVNAVGAGGTPRYAVVGGQGGYGLGQVGTRYTGPLWSTPPGQTPAPTNTQPQLAKPLSPLGLPEWLLDPSGTDGMPDWLKEVLGVGAEADGGSGGKPAPGGGGGGGSTTTPPTTPAASTDPRSMLTADRRALGWQDMQFVQPHTTMPAGYRELTTELDPGSPLEREARMIAQQRYGEQWGRPANIARAYREVLDKNKLWSPRVEQTFQREIERGILPSFRPGNFDPALHYGANPEAPAPVPGGGSAGGGGGGGSGGGGGGKPAPEDGGKPGPGPN